MRSARGLLFVLIGAGIAAQVTGNAPSAALETVTVQARVDQRTLQQRVNDFVGGITMAASGESLARWQVPLCPRVLGLPQQQIEFVEQRLARLAANAGLRVDTAPCSMNLVVIMTPEPEKLLQELFHERPRRFNTERGITGVKRFIGGGAAVRAWYNACSAPGGRQQLNSVGNLQCNVGEPGSRLKFHALRAIYSVIVVVDLNRIEGLKFGQLSDYIAMIGLAPIRDAANVGDAPSILRLLNASVTDKPATLSAWDQAFLKSLYRTDPSNVTQIWQIKHAMARDLDH